MSKRYSLKKIRQYIEQFKKDGLISADVGMYEDWGPTADEIWNKKDGYLINKAYGPQTKPQYDFNETPKEDEILIGGILSSTWATPQMVLSFKDGTEKVFDVYVDDGKAKKMPKELDLINTMDSILGFKTFRKRDG